MKENNLYRLIEVVMAIIISGILFILIFIDKRFNYVFENFCVIPNWGIVGVIALIIFGYVFLHNKVHNGNRENRKNTENSVLMNKMQIKLERRNLWLMSVVFFGVQLIVAWQIYFKTGWDCGDLVQMAQKVAFEYADIGNDAYFAMYPNNVLLVAVFAAVLRFVDFLGFHADYFPLIMVGCLLVNLAGFFMADTIRKLTEKHTLALAAWGLYVFLVGLSPWISIPYSDTYSILFPILCIWLYVNRTEKNKYRIWAGIGFAAWIGHYIKPTVLLVFIVLIGLEIWHFLCKMKEMSKNDLRKGTIRTINFILVLALSVGLATGLNGLAKHKMGCSMDEDKQFTAVHYLMMGLNYSTCGTYDQNDVNFSASAANVSERNKQAFTEAGNRISEMGVKGFATHLLRKVLTNFNDGTFAWGHEGEFYWNIPEKNNGLAKWLRSYFYEGGSNTAIFQCTTQIAWMIVLCMLPCFFIRRRREIGQQRAAICLSIVAICCFVMVFEARARYLYLYSPVFILAATLGLERLIENLEIRISRK